MLAKLRHPAVVKIFHIFVQMKHSATLDGGDMEHVMVWMEVANKSSRPA